MVDEFSFFSYNKTSDWEKGKSYNIQDFGGHLCIAQSEKYEVHSTIRFRSIEGLKTICNFSLGSEGKIYLLDDAANVWIYDYENKITELLFTAGHGLFTKDAIMASEGDTLYIADFMEEPHISAYSVTNGQTIWKWDQWREDSLYPLAITNDLYRNVYILFPMDVIHSEEGVLTIPDNGRLGILKINKAGKVMCLIDNECLTTNRLITFKSLRDSTRMTVSNDQVIYIHNADSKINYIFDLDGRLLSQASVIQDHPFSGLGTDSHGNVYMGDSRKASYKGEDDRFIVKFNAQGDFQAKISVFRGKAKKLLFDYKNRLYIFDDEEMALTILEPKLKSVQSGGAKLIEGVFLSTALDSTSSETHWHKLQMEAHIPDETQIKISYYCSDRKQLIWNGNYMDMDQLIMSDEISWQEKIKGLKSFWSQEIINPKDALIFDARGRYLWIKIDLIGSEEETPLLKRLRVYFPRKSYLDVLPAVYQENKQSSEFLERFLSLFGTFFIEMEERIGSITQYFDVETVSGPFLQWIGTWLGIAVDDTWNEQQLRELIRQAPQLYKERGTKSGIEKMVQIYTGEKPIIIEHFQLKHLNDKVELRDLLSQLYGTDPYTFNVLIKPHQVSTEKQRLVVQKIVDDQKPAFTEANLVVLEPWIYINMHSYLEVNTYLSEPSLLRLDQKSSIPNNTILIDMDRDNRIDIHTRLELDSELE